MSSSFRIAIALVIIIAISSSVLSAPQDRKPQSKVIKIGLEDIGEPSRVFDSFGRAWLRGDAQEIVSLASDSPILLEVRGLEIKGGYFTKSQLLYILKNMFANTRQISFEFVKFHDFEKKDQRVYGIAQRSYRVKGGDIYRDKVYVTLVKEGSRWAVAEIKSTW